MKDKISFLIIVVLSVTTFAFAKIAFASGLFSNKATLWFNNFCTAQKAPFLEGPASALCDLRDRVIVLETAQPTIGPQGPVGSQGPTGPSLKVVDANGIVVGYLIAPPSPVSPWVAGTTFTVYSSTDKLFFQVTNGTQTPPINGIGPNYSIGYMYYSQPNCSGIAYADASFHPEFPYTLLNQPITTNGTVVGANLFIWDQALPTLNQWQPVSYLDPSGACNSGGSNLKIAVPLKTYTINLVAPFSVVEL